MSELYLYSIPKYEMPADKDSNLSLYSVPKYEIPSDKDSNLSLYSTPKYLTPDDKDSSMYLYSAPAAKEPGDLNSDLYFYSEVTADSTYPRRNIAMVVNDKTHASCTNTKAMLEGKGHTVTVFGETEITASNLESYDLIMPVRASYNGTTWQDIVVGYRNNGKPVILSMDQGLFEGINTTSSLVRMNLAHSQYTGSILLGVIISDNSHSITQPYGLTSYAVYSSSTWMTGVNSNYSSVGTKLAYHSYGGNHDAIVAYEKGINDLSGNPINSRMVFLGFLYGLNGYTTDGANLINNAVLWATEPIEEPTQPTKKRRLVSFT